MADRSPTSTAPAPRAAPGNAATPSASPAMPPAAGPAMTLNAWLRWDVVRRVLADLPLRSVLEIGCGQGAVGARLTTRYEYVGYEPDAESYARARTRVEAAIEGGPSGAPSRARGRVHNSVLPARPDRSFDLVCAFEVLEHIEDDQGALTAWVEWLRPGGLLLVSVPADPDRFGPADEAVGHYRRYDPATLAGLLAGAGLVERELWRYGFPLGYLLEVARDRMAGRAREAAPTGSREDASEDASGDATGDATEDRSGGSRAERTAASGRWGQPPDSLGWMTRWATLPFRLAQRPFTRSGLGTGIIAAGRRPA